MGFICGRNALDAGLLNAHAATAGGAVAPTQGVRAPLSAVTVRRRRRGPCVFDEVRAAVRPRALHLRAC